MEGDPFAVVEAMAIEAFAVGGQGLPLHSRRVPWPAPNRERNHGGDRSRPARRARHRAARRRRLHLRRGTALFESIEGKRGEPRNKPPFPVEVGLFDKPTAVNNVETIVNVLLIVGEDGGAEAFKAIGTEGRPARSCSACRATSNGPGRTRSRSNDAGRAARARRRRPDGRAIKAILLGGAAGVFVGPDALDLPLTFEATRAAGATLGSGVVMVFDERADLVGTLTRIAQFFRDESCGQCVPCRVGTVRQEELLARLAAGSACARARTSSCCCGRSDKMRDASICGLGQTASSAIRSAFRQPGLVAL